MIKWFDSRLMTGLPDLTNTQGDLVKMLTGLLVNGANSKTVTTVSYADGVCTLEVGASHGFVLHSVVRVQGSTQSALTGKDFRIKALTTTTISFDCSIAVTAEIGLSVRYEPLGWTQYFESEGKACFKSPNPEYPAYLRVDDTKIANVNEQHAKFARVEICENMTDFDSADWQSPYDANYPSLNRAATSESTGWYKWYYAAARTVNADGDTPENGSRRYVLIGDSNYFWLIIYPYVNGGLNSNYGAVYGFAFADYGASTKQALIATNGFGAVGAGRNQPHISFINSYASKGIAPLNDVLSSAMPSYLAGASVSQPDVVLLANSPVIDSSLALMLPIYLSNSGIKAKFESVFLSPNNLGDDVIKTDDGLYKSLNINQSYYLTFGLG